MDPASIGAIVVSAVGSLLLALHIRKCNVCCCINSDCSKTPPNTPTNKDESNS